MRPIDADALDVEQINAYYVGSCRTEDVQEWLDDQPTLDVAPVVRCKDCKHWGYGVPGDGEEMRVCIENAEVDMPCDGYCHKGERRN